MGGTKKKVGKERLDKFYHLAKDQGYRARSAFKLIQLAKKYDLFKGARSCIDLCAAPGGWTQVAAKNMPSGSIIIGVDLAPIKPIRGAVCMQCDITTQQCRTMLSKELKGNKCDIVLNDGAPNVGASWSKDAYGQAELTLHATKLACDFLSPGGAFVTKIFRSGDSNSLLWVFQQLFNKVEVTKPQASRQVSAEVFVTCLGFKAPAKIDPRFFEPKWVFMETIDDKQSASTLSDYVKSAMKKRRGGYDAGDEYRVITALQFMEEKRPAELLVRSHKMVFPPEAQHLNDHKLTTEEIHAICDDLQVAGKRELSLLMKWRMKILREQESEKKQRADEAKAIAKDALKASKELDGSDAESDDDVVMDDGESQSGSDSDGEDGGLDDTLDAQLRKEKAEAKRKRRMKKKMEWRKKMSFGTFDAAADTLEPDLFKASKRSKNALDEANQYLREKDFDSDASDSDVPEESDDEVAEMYEGKSRLEQMELDMAISMEVGKALMSKKQEQRERGQKKETRRQRVTAEWSRELEHFNDNLEKKAEVQYMDDQKDSDDDEEDFEEDDKTMEEKREALRADRWFSQEIFGDLEMGDGETAQPNPEAEDDEEEKEESKVNELDDSELPQLPMTDKQKRKIKRKKELEKAKARGEIESDQEDFETVPAEEAVPLDEHANPVLVKPEEPEELAETLAMGSMMIQKKARMDLIDAGYNRYSFNDAENIPDWFTEEERHYNKPELPVSKELMQEFRAKLREINARPIRKVAEAQARKKKRMALRLEKVRKQAQSLAESTEMSAHMKTKQVAKLMKKAGKREERVKVYSRTNAGGGGKVNLGGKKAGKGKGKINMAGAKVKLVDKRMKKDKRAAKRISKGGAAKKTKGKGGKGRKNNKKRGKR